MSRRVSLTASYGFKKRRHLFFTYSNVFELILKLKASLIRNEEIDIHESIDFLHTFGYVLVDP